MSDGNKPPANGDEPQESGENTGEQSGDTGEQPGRMRFQDADTTTPREPTLAEHRARIAAEKRQEEKLAEAERKTEKRRRVMVGGGVSVGVVALVAAFYSGSAYSAEKNAVSQYCAAEQGGNAVAKEENLCDEEYVEENGGYTNGGMFFMPFFLPGGGVGGYNQYRYGYTSPGAPAPTPGSTVSNPSFNKPSNATIKNSKGATVQRGGFGIGNKSGSGS
ncbi:hypothetical protein [Parasphingorhabdus pacifica]